MWVQRPQGCYSKKESLILIAFVKYQCFWRLFINLIGNGCLTLIIYWPWCSCFLPVLGSSQHVDYSVPKLLSPSRFICWRMLNVFLRFIKFSRYDGWLFDRQRQSVRHIQIFTHFSTKAPSIFSMKISLHRSFFLQVCSAYLFAVKPYFLTLQMF